MKISEKFSPNFRRAGRVTLWVVVVGVFAYVMFRPDVDHSWTIHIRNERTIEQLEREVASYQKRTEYNRERLRLLQSDKELLERFARERYRMKEADEDVFVIDRKDGK